MRKVLVLGTAVTLAGLVLAASPASAAVSVGDTVITAPVGVTDLLAIAAAPTALAAGGATLVATIPTTVTDARLTGTGWTVSISSTALTLAGVSSPSSAQTIPASDLKAYTGTVVPNVTGTVSVTAGYTSSAPLTLSSAAQTLLTATSRTNVNVVPFTTSVSIPTADKTTGVYTGTVTQSVA